jgi:HSP20 family protein
VVKKETPAAAPAEAEPSIFAPMVALRRQIDDLVEDAFGRFPYFWMPRIEWPAFPKGEGETEPAPAHFDFSESDKAVTVTADVPGMTEEDIDISVDNGVLTIKGEKKSEREEKGENFYLSERRFGSFSRAFRLPEGVNEDEITALFKKGVLTVTMPKATAEKKVAKRIDLKPEH